MADEFLSINQWAEDDRPREKLMQKGRHVLSDAELIAILIGSGSKNESAVSLSQRILNKFNGDLDTLGKLTIADFTKFKGIGEAKAISIIAALELGRRRRETEKPKETIIGSSKDAYLILKTHFEDLPHEEFRVLLLNRRHKVIGNEHISKGGISSTVTDIRMIMKAAIENLASAIILAHNHPSGTLKPSQQDIALTKKIKQMCDLLEINLLDHIIITDKSFFSLADEGMM